HVVALFGEGRARRRGGHHDRAFLRIDVGRGDRRAGTEVADHEIDLVGDELVGDGYRLLRVAGVVAELQHQLFAEHAALGVDLGDRGFGAAPRLLADGGDLPGEGGSQPDGDIRLRFDRHEAEYAGPT